MQATSHGPLPYLPCGHPDLPAGGSSQRTKTPWVQCGATRVDPVVALRDE
jgi:hypothetical protein